MDPRYPNLSSHPATFRRSTHCHYTYNDSVCTVQWIWNKHKNCLKVRQELQESRDSCFWRP